MADQNPLAKLLGSFLPPKAEGPRVPRPLVDPHPTKGKEAFATGVDLILGGLGLRDPLAEEATGATGLGSLLGMIGPAAMVGGVRGLYSRVDDAAKLIPKGGAHPNKVMSLLKNNASGEELAWRGVPEFVAAQGERVTPEALAAHLQARPAPMPQKKTLTMETPKTIRGKDGWTIDGRPATLEEAMDASVPSDPPKYAAYQVPGGTDYRETLSVMPAANKSRYGFRIETNPDGVGYVVLGDDGRKYARLDEREDAEDTLRNLIWKNGVDAKDKIFTSPHFDTPNVLVHTRSNTRTLPTGERGTLIENVQSDWHQAGRKGGYGASKYSETDALANAIEPGSYAVPDAPFKDSWPELGLKQEVLDAVSRDAEWIGITPAATLNARGEAISEAFQDQRLPLTLEKILKPFGGGRVSREVLSTEPKAIGLQGWVSTPGGRTAELGPAEGDPLASMLPQFAGEWDVREALAQQISQRLPSVTSAEAFIARLTPEMRAAIKEKGLPLLLLLMGLQAGQGGSALDRGAAPVKR